MIEKVLKKKREENNNNFFKYKLGIIELIYTIEFQL